jgi:hypothetical protein
MNTFLENGTPEILIAEDSITQAEQLKQVLENDGFRVAIARDGRKALAALRTRKPTLIISDITIFAAAFASIPNSRICPSSFSPRSPIPRTCSAGCNAARTTSSPSPTSRLIW